MSKGARHVVGVGQARYEFGRVGGEEFVFDGGSCLPGSSKAQSTATAGSRANRCDGVHTFVEQETPSLRVEEEESYYPGQQFEE